MPENPRTMVRIADWPGLDLETDETDLLNGASHDQVNATSEDRGVLQSRKGYRVVEFEGE